MASLCIPKMEALRMLQVHQIDEESEFQLQYEQGTLKTTLPSLETLSLIPNVNPETETFLYRFEPLNPHFWEFDPEEVAQLAHTGVYDFRRKLGWDIAILPQLTTLLPSVTRLELELSHNVLNSFPCGQI